MPLRAYAETDWEEITPDTYRKVQNSGIIVLSEQLENLGFIEVL